MQGGQSSSGQSLRTLTSNLNGSLQFRHDFGDGLKAVDETYTADKASTRQTAYRRIRRHAKFNLDYVPEKDTPLEGWSHVSTWSRGGL
jgi:hypothetical protein